MNFSSLVLMEKDMTTNMLVRELGSYEIEEGGEYLTKMFFDGEKVNIYFDTCTDVDEWEYTAIFDLFKEERFLDRGYSLETIDDEFNPTWRVKFDFSEEHTIMQGRIKELCLLIKEQMEIVIKEAKEHEEEYK